MASYPRVIPVGDMAVSVEFGNTIDTETHGQVRALEAALLALAPPGLRETVPSFRSLLVTYEPAEIGWPELLEVVRTAWAGGRPPAVEPGRVWTIPVAYGAPSGDDLEEVARRCDMTPDEVVATHSGPDYLTYLVGFAPGIPLLGGLPGRLHLPRRTAPRPKVPARSVIIAGGQASIMSIEAPSGWHILGRTPIWPYQPGRAEPFLFRPGDVVRFKPIDQAEYGMLAHAAAAGEEILTPGLLPIRTGGPGRGGPDAKAAGSAAGQASPPRGTMSRTDALTGVR